jgi:hypothetical protein
VLPLIQQKYSNIALTLLKPTYLSSRLGRWSKYSTLDVVFINDERILVALSLIVSNFLEETEFLCSFRCDLLMLLLLLTKVTLLDSGSVSSDF